MATHDRKAADEKPKAAAKERAEERAPERKGAAEDRATEEAKAPEERAAEEAGAAVPELFAMPAPLAGPVLADGDKGYKVAGEWAGHTMYETTFDQFSTTDEAVMREYVKGYRQRAPGQVGRLPEEEQRFRRERGG